MGECSTVKNWIKKQVTTLAIIGSGAVFWDDNGTKRCTWDLVESVRSDLTRDHGIKSKHIPSQKYFPGWIAFLESCFNRFNNRDDSLLKIAKDARSKLAEKFANSNIRSRLDEFREPEGFWSDTVVICSNWDETIFLNSKIPNVIQIHGRASVSDTLILPGQHHYQRWEKTSVKPGFEVNLLLVQIAPKKVLVYGSNINDYDLFLWHSLSTLLAEGIYGLNSNQPLPTYLYLGEKNEDNKEKESVFSRLKGHLSGFLQKTDRNSFFSSENNG